MRLKIVLFILIISSQLYSTTIDSVKIDFNNGNQLSGRIVDFKDNKLYLNSKGKLYIINIELIDKLNYKNRQIDKNKLLLIKFDRLLWSEYSEKIKLDSESSISFDTNKLTDPRYRIDNIFIDKPEIYLLNKTGKSLKSYTSYYYSGLLISIIGTIVIVSTNDTETQTVGLGISSLGGLISIFSASKIDEAGNYLIKLSQIKDDSTKVK